MTNKLQQSDTQSDRYSQKAGVYYSVPRYDYVADLPANPMASILDIGCGDGATGALALKSGKCSSYIGVELFEPAALRAKQVLTSVLNVNIENADLPFSPGTFDAIICSEVLEHLVNPEEAVRKLVVLLKPGGRIYASSPNISHWRIITDLIRGRFEYVESGALDETHLRWFTPTSFRKMFERCGIRVDMLQPVGGLPGRKGVLARLLGPSLSHLVWYRIDLHGYLPRHHSVSGASKLNNPIEKTD